MTKREKPAKYNEDLKGDVEISTQQAPRAVVHATEWRKIMNGELFPSVSHPSPVFFIYCDGSLFGK